MSIGIEIQPRPPGLRLRVGAWGAEGWGEAARADAEEVRALLVDLPVEAEDFREMLDSRDPPPAIRCAIVGAWLSARAAATGLSLAGLLAAGRVPAEEVPLCPVIPAEAPDQAAKRAAALAAQGHRALLLRCGPDRAADLTRVAAVRAAAPGLALRLDAAGAWEPSVALEHLRALWRHDIEHVVQPIPPSRPLAELAAFRRACPVPVALAADPQGPATVERILALRAADAVIVDPVRLGGPDRAAAAIEAVLQTDLPPLVAAGPQGVAGTAMALHVAATLHGPLPACAIEFSAEARDVLRPGAWALVPAGPGLGLALGP
jgi:L-alanine-DL-glutamate epimerase-like enolase superfamily enzyme